MSVLALEVEESECGLLLDGAEASESSAEEGVCEEGRDGGGEPGFGGDEGLGDAGGEECGVAAAVEGDELEGVDHAGDGAEESEEGCGGGADGDEGEEPFESCVGVEGGLVERLLEVVGWEVGVLARGVGERLEGLG